ncbi:coiled-coil domain-containing protein [Aeromonas veronii]|uniref:hypothetical protein n=1 Tax=Aeromonas veronii TaxID=654 RepID=UPI002B46EF44|nr:hypothetical protein [Aeromonas veronii]
MRKTIPRVTNNNSLHEIKNELAVLKQALVEKDNLLNTVNESSFALQVQLEICQGKSARLTADNVALKARIKGLEQEHQTRNSELATLSKLILKSDETAQQSAAQLKKSHLELDGCKSELSKAKAALDISQTKLKKAESELGLLKQSHSKTKQELENELGKLKSQLVKEKELNHSLSSQLTNLQDNLNVRFSELAKLSNILEVKERKLLAKDNELSIYKEQLDKLKASFAWKAAAPARALSNKFKKKNTKSMLRQHAEVVQNSGLFSVDWYRKNCPEIDELSISPVEHYLTIGFKVGLTPSERFDGNDYLARYPDVQQEGVNPLLHYLMFGKNEGRTI